MCTHGTGQLCIYETMCLRIHKGLPVRLYFPAHIYMSVHLRLSERREGGEGAKSREGPRLRVTTVLSGAPRPQAAGCLVRLQLPPSPSTRAGGGQRPPPPGEGNEKIRDDTQGGKKVLVLAPRAQSRERVRCASRRMVPQRITLCVIWGCTAPATPPRVRGRRVRSAGAWAPGSLRGITSRGVR